MRNWKTTLLGIASIVSVVAKVIVSPTGLDGQDIAAVLAGIGLIVAKDSDVSGTKW